MGLCKYGIVLPTTVLSIRVWRYQRQRNQIVSDMAQGKITLLVCSDVKPRLRNHVLSFFLSFFCFFFFFWFWGFRVRLVGDGTWEGVENVMRLRDVT